MNTDFDTVYNICGVLLLLVMAYFLLHFVITIFILINDLNTFFTTKTNVFNSFHSFLPSRGISRLQDLRSHLLQQPYAPPASLYQTPDVQHIFLWLYWTKTYNRLFQMLNISPSMLLPDTSTLLPSEALCHLSSPPSHSLWSSAACSFPHISYLAFFSPVC